MAFVVAEYCCPEHDRFDALTERTPFGDAPDECPCPAILMIDGEHGMYEQACGRMSPWAISAPLGRVKLGEVHRGKSDPHLPHQLDTRPLADGMPPHEWNKLQEKKGIDIRHKLNKKALS